MAATKLTGEAETFANYLEGKKILIADTSATARSGLYRVFADLGAKPHQIKLVNTFKQAAEEISQSKPHLVIAEYDLGRRCGLDLLQTQREQLPDETKRMIFVVVTGNTSQSAVARAAEEDIDAYILKPFTPEVVRKTIIRAALMKTSPPEYIVRIEQAKAAIGSGQLDKAEQLLTEACELDPAPSLALYYLGQAKVMREIMDQARGSYSKGLEFNKIHYKCMVGLYELMVKQKSHHEAYEVVKKISQYFPANPKRLSEVLRLAIVNGKYEDVEKYYGVFCNIDERDDLLIKYVCAALVVCGKYYLGTKSKSRALELFQKAAATGTGRTRIIREIIQALLDCNLIKEAKEYLAKFSSENLSEADCLLSKFLILNAEGRSALILDFGRQLLAQEIADERLYEIMIKRSFEAKLDVASEALVQEAIEKFPAKKAEYERLYASLKQAG